MTSANDYQPRAEDKFSFGLWTVGNRGRDAFGDAVRPHILPLKSSPCWRKSAPGASTCMTTISCRSTQPRRTRQHRSLVQAGLRRQQDWLFPWRPSHFFFHPVFRDGAFTANDPEVLPTPCKRPCGHGYWSRARRQEFLLWVAAKAWRLTHAAGG